MKKLITALTIAALLFSSSLVSASPDEIEVYIDGEKINFELQAPVIENGTTLVPMRAMFEALGATVDWNGDLRTAYGTSLATAVAITIDENIMRRNILEVPLDVPARIINDCTMIPLRAVSECFGMQVDWDNDNRIITLTDKHVIGKMYWNDNYDYYGEMTDNTANGYGMIRNKDTLELIQMGYYLDNQITEGIDYYDNGDYYIGEFQDGKHNGYGEYYSSEYNTVFKGNYLNNMRYGEGTTYFNDGSYVVANYIDGEWNGNVYVYDANGIIVDSEYYINGMTESEYNITVKQEQLQEAYAQLEYWQQELNNLDAEAQAVTDEYSKDYEEYLDFLNSDPFETDWAQEILEQYGITDNDSSDSGNIDSFAQANANRQQLANLNAATAVILETFNMQCESMASEIEQKYENAMSRIAMQRKNINSAIAATQSQIQQLSGSYSESSNNLPTTSSETDIVNTNFPWHLYSNDGKVYLGKLTPSSIRDEDSVWNEYGDYGSKYHDNIWNTRSEYGSERSDTSAFNESATHPPKIVDNYGNLIGYLTINPDIEKGITLEKLTQYLKGNQQ